MMDNNFISSITPVYTLSITAEISKIPVHSIRQYIDKGLIIPFKKESNRHLFSDVDIIRLKYIQKLLVDERMNIAGIKNLLAIIPCWAIRNCSGDDRKECHAFKSTSFPCWEASEKGTLCRNSDCRECKVYRVVEEYPDIKTFIRTFLSEMINAS